VQEQLGGDVGVGLEAEEAEFGDGHFGALASTPGRREFLFA
jgi:hypothetical protein